MSVKSQENNMHRLADLLSQDLSYIGGERECGPNGAKKTFLNLGKVFLRALAKDLGLRDAKITSNPGGINISLSQFCGGKNVLLYRTVRHTRDYTGGYNSFLSLNDLQELSYPELLDKLSALRKEGNVHEQLDSGHRGRAA